MPATARSGASVLSSAGAQPVVHGGQESSAQPSHNKPMTLTESRQRSAVVVLATKLHGGL